MKHKVAAIQMASGPNVAANLNEAGRLIGEAAEAGAALVVLPENFAFFGTTEEDKLAVAEEDGAGPIQEFLAEQSARRRVWLVGGTVPLVAATRGRVRASCLMYDAQGRRVARYDKIHLFDVQVESGEEYHESRTIEPGSEVVVVDTPFGAIGLSVCYDLRFPELFRGLAEQGAEIFVLPSAFTAITGRAHWEILVRARAVENQCYFIAPDQGGYHVNGRETHGDSMIVDPWGVVLGRLARGTGMVLAEIDRERLLAIRRSFPSLTHRRLS